MPTTPVQSGQVGETRESQEEHNLRLDVWRALEEWNLTGRCYNPGDWSLLRARQALRDHLLKAPSLEPVIPAKPDSHDDLVAALKPFGESCPADDHLPDNELLAIRSPSNGQVFNYIPVAAFRAAYAALRKAGAL